MSERGSRDATVHRIPSLSRRGVGGCRETVSPLQSNNPHSLAGRARAVPRPRGFATWRTQRLTSMGVRPTGLGEGNRVKRDAMLGEIAYVILRNPPSRDLAFPFPLPVEKAWVWRASRKLGHDRVPSVFLVRPTFITLGVS